MEKINNRVENMRQFKHKYWKSLAEKTGRTEAQVAYDSLLPEQRELIIVLGKFVTKEGEAVPFTCQQLKREWQYWNSSAEVLLPEMPYTDTVDQVEQNVYKVSPFGIEVYWVAEQTASRLPITS